MQDTKAVIIDDALKRLQELATSTVTPPDSEKAKPVPVKITVEICGSWIWIDGETRTVKEELKNIGCWWSPTKEKWYWRSPESKRSFGRGNVSMPKIRDIFGSMQITTDASKDK